VPVYSCFVFGHSLGGVLALRLAMLGLADLVYCFEPVIFPPELDQESQVLGSQLALRAQRRQQWFQSREDALAHFSAKPPFQSFDDAALKEYVDHGLEAGKSPQTAPQLRPVPLGRGSCCGAELVWFLNPVPLRSSLSSGRL